MLGRGERGVSLLLELLIGFSILAIAIMAIFALFPSGDKAVMRSIRMTQANEIGRGLMEDQMGKHYSAVTEGTVTGSTSDSSIDRNGQSLVTEYFYRVDITKPNPDRNYRDIVVEVWWNEGNDQVRHGCKMESSKGEFF